MSEYQPKPRKKQTGSSSKTSINKLTQNAITKNGQGIDVNALLKAKGLPDHNKKNDEGASSAQAALYNNAMPYSESKAMAQAALEAQLGSGFTPFPDSTSPFPSNYSDPDDNGPKNKK